MTEASAGPGAPGPRDRLLDTVVTVALDGGISGMSLRGIAEAAGTSHRMLIHHFGSREGLLVAVIQRVEAQQRALMVETGAVPGPASADLAYDFWLNLRSPALAPQERLFFEVYGQALAGRAWAQPLLDGIVSSWADPTAAIIEAAGVDPATARAAARLMVGVGRGMLLDVLATGEGEAVDAAMRLFSDMLVSVLARGSTGLRPAGMAGPDTGSLGAPPGSERPGG